MGGASQGKVGFHIPFEIAHDGTHATNAFFKTGVVCDLVRQHMPVSGWRFGVRTVRPKLGHHPSEISQLHEVRCVWLTRDRIDWMTRAVVETECVVAQHSRRNVDQRFTVELAALDQQLHRRSLVGRIGGRWRAWHADLEKRTRVQPEITRVLPLQ